MAAGNGTNGIPQSMQEGFKILMQKADTLHEFCVAGEVARAPRAAPGPVPAPVQQWMLPTSPKRARDPSDTDPCQTKSDSEQEAALAERVEVYPVGEEGRGAQQGDRGALRVGRKVVEGVVAHDNGAEEEGEEG